MITLWGVRTFLPKGLFDLVKTATSLQRTPETVGLYAGATDLKGHWSPAFSQGMGREFELPAEMSGEARTSGLFEKSEKAATCRALDWRSR
jgi:hypothetical protein